MSRQPLPTINIPEGFLNLNKRKAAFAALGNRLRNLTEEELSEVARGALSGNTWFDFVNVTAALNAWGELLREENLDAWLSAYLPDEEIPEKAVGVIMAGNIPAVGFHDLLTVLICGHRIFAKLSKDDTFLMRWLSNQLIDLEPDFADRIQFPELLKNIDTVIATGSDNTARYFLHYFAHLPHLIRQNRTSVAVLNGKETATELAKLGEDIFRYYGLGCRNVSKLLVPEGYDFIPLLDALAPWESVASNHKYNNNYDYNKSIYLVNREPHLDTGYLLLRASDQLVSPISVVYYQTYSSGQELEEILVAQQDKLQCVVTDGAQLPGSFDFGQAQTPALWNYADGADTVQFLGLRL
jgi:hypothetical protein